MQIEKLIQSSNRVLTFYYILSKFSGIDQESMENKLQLSELAIVQGFADKVESMFSKMVMGFSQQPRTTFLYEEVRSRVCLPEEKDEIEYLLGIRNLLFIDYLEELAFVASKLLASRLARPSPSQCAFLAQMVLVSWLKCFSF